MFSGQTNLKLNIQESVNVVNEMGKMIEQFEDNQASKTLNKKISLKSKMQMRKENQARQAKEILEISNSSCVISL